VVVAQNNLIVGSRDRKAYDSIKALRAAYTENVKFRLTAKQNRSIDMNMLLLLMSGGAAELEQCRKLCSVKTSSLDPATASVKATLLFLDKKADAAISLLKPFIANGPLSLKLLSAQMSIHENDIPSAIAILDTLVKEDNLRLGIVSALSKLHVALGDMPAGIATIDATIKRTKRGHGLWPLIQDAVRLHEAAGNVQSAAAALEKYSTSGPRKNVTLAHLVELTARFDSDKAEKLSLNLPPLPSDPSIDVDALENSTSRRGITSRAPAADSNSSRKGGAVDAERVARIRVRRKAKKAKALRKKLGASFNPKHQPDINKWLPYADRPGSKRRNWKKDAVRGSQGTAAPTSTVPSAAATTAAPVAALAGGGAAPQKKSSKGRR
jgi:signal recognition particle subunit SRP72